MFKLIYSHSQSLNSIEVLTVSQPGDEMLYNMTPIYI